MTPVVHDSAYPSTYAGRVLPRIALCAHATPTLAETISLAREVAGPVCIEYSFDPGNLSSALRDAEAIHRLADRDVEMRYHFPLGRFELANLDESSADEALVQFLSATDIVAKSGGRYLTVHAALHGGAHEYPVFARTKERLQALVEHGREVGVTVCLENLYWGLTSEPEHFADLVEFADAAVTLDVGHAVSSETARAGTTTGAEFAQTLAPRIVGAHVYDREDPHHIAPTDLERIGDTLAVLLSETACRWWVIELFSAKEIRSTRGMLLSLLHGRFGDGRLTLPLAPLEGGHQLGEGRPNALGDLIGARLGQA
jgi:sugar phosphate isomerase/epimerase